MRFFCVSLGKTILNVINTRHFTVEETYTIKFHFNSKLDNRRMRKKNDNDSKVSEVISSYS